MAAACHSISNGAEFYYKSDIKKFFTQIPRENVVEIIASHINDREFINLIQNATNLEIQNLESIPRDKRHYFDFDSIGTPCPPCEVFRCN